MERRTVESIVRSAMLVGDLGGSGTGARVVGRNIYTVVPATIYL